MAARQAQNMLEAWRHERLLVEDRDFVFHNTPFERAYKEAGGSVADAWLKARKQEEPLLADATAHHAAFVFFALVIHKVEVEK
eukprot:4318558-Karenia_brevis.AAC.1